MELVHVIFREHVRAGGLTAASTRERHKGTDYVTSPVEGIPECQSRHCDVPQHLKAPLSFLMSSEVLEDLHLQRRAAQLTLRCE